VFGIDVDSERVIIIIIVIVECGEVLVIVCDSAIGITIASIFLVETALTIRNIIM
jgi:hypothetical protein